MDSCLLINHIKDTLRYSKRERRKMHAEGWNEKWEKKGQIKPERCYFLTSMKHLPHQHLYVVQASTPLPLTTCKRLSSLCVNMHMHVLLCGYHEWLSYFGHQFSGVETEASLLFWGFLQICMCTGAWGVWMDAWGWLSNHRSVSWETLMHTQRENESEGGRERGQATYSDVCLLISLPCINSPVKAQPGGKLISYYLIILLGFAWSVC